MTPATTTDSRVPPAPAASLGWSRLPAEYAIPPTPPSLEQAEEYCRRLARAHYENFSVATWFLPKKLRQDFLNVYAYCRISDDLGDEVGDPTSALALLDEWQSQLDACYAGTPRHPVFVALAETVRKFDIPKQEFADLLIAFRQDQTVTRFETFDDLLGYCRYSANPVGHLVLYLCGYRDAERQQLSDYTCTALQLANFWQDIGVDLEKGRVYLPLDLLAKHGYKIDELIRLEENDRSRAVLREAVGVAEALFEKGLPLIRKVDRRLSLDLDLFSRGGMKILQKIRMQDYNVLRQRPHISKTERAGVLLQCLARLLPF